VDDTLKDAESRMKKSVEVLKKDLMGIRTGRANTGLVEHLMVDYYGAPTPLNQLGTLSTPEPRLITVQAWDKAAVPAIEKSILKSDLGLNPSSDWMVVRIPVPSLTAERRKDLIKVVKKRVEEGKIAVRNVRRDGVEHLRTLEKDKRISQDEQHRGQDKLQGLTDAYVGQMDEAGSHKESELLEV
jgi:ribosome recycling factor